MLEGLTFARLLVIAVMAVLLMAAAAAVTQRFGAEARRFATAAFFLAFPSWIAAIYLIQGDL